MELLDTYIAADAHIFISRQTLSQRDDRKMEAILNCSLVIFVLMGKENCRKK